MKIILGPWELEIKITNRQPWERDTANLVRHVDFEADAEYEQAHYRGSLKIMRIKIFRQIASDRGWDLGLKDCREWVERYFDNYGHGLPL